MIATQEKIPMREDIKVERHLPYSFFVDEKTIETKSGHLLQVIKLEGIHAETLDDDWIEREKILRHHLLMSLTDSTTSFYFHTVRKKVNEILSGRYESKFLQQLEQKWNAHLQEKSFFITEHYLTIVKKPPVSVIRGFSDILNSFSASFVREEKDRYRLEMLKELNKTSIQLLTSLKAYSPYVLENVIAEEQNYSLSPSLSFLNYLINLEEEEMAVPDATLSTILPRTRLCFDAANGTMAVVNNRHQVTYAAILSIKNYAHKTLAGALDRLQALPAEMIITQSFKPVEKHAIREKIKKENRHHSQSDDGITQASCQIETVLDEMNSGNVTMGWHHFSVLCHAASPALLNHVVAEVEAALSFSHMIALREYSGLKPAFFAMLPANDAYIVRKGLISSKNMASLASFHNVSTGKAKGNFWGDAITLLETETRAPYYFNFHVLDVGNTFMIGPQGSGKTLLQTFLLGLSLKHGGRLIVLDKDRGFELFVRIVGGAYRVMTPGKRTGFAPFKMVDTANNRFFLVELLRMIAQSSGYPINSETIAQLKQTVEGAFTLPPEKRIFRNVVAFLGLRKTGSLRACFDNWIEEGHYAWIFDNEEDDFSLDYQTIGIEMGSIISNPAISSPIYFYLFHRIEMLLDGTPTRIVAAESWSALQDETFRNKINEWNSIPRKKNVFLVLDTQAPSDIAKSVIGKKIIQECVTQIYFANPKAQAEDYVDGFCLTKKEHALIQTLDKESRYFLIKQNKGSHIVRAYLPPSFLTDIAVLSGTSENLKLMDTLREQKGHDVEAWLPAFYEAIRNKERMT